MVVWHSWSPVNNCLRLNCPVVLFSAHEPEPFHEEYCSPACTYETEVFPFTSFTSPPAPCSPIPLALHRAQALTVQFCNPLHLEHPFNSKQDPCFSIFRLLDPPFNVL